MQAGVTFMQSGLILLNELREADIDWILSAGREEAYAADQIVVAQGSLIDSIYLVLSGLLKVYLGAPGGKELATLGPGQIVGEMSLLEGRPASATVVAVEDSQLLVLPRERVDPKLAEDHGFSARLYKALAIVTSRRLRDTMGALARWTEEAPTGEAVRSREEVAQWTHRFKTRLIQLQKKSALEATDEPEFQKELAAFCLFLKTALGEDSGLLIDAREDLGARVQREILPYLLRSTLAHRFYLKPRGYPQDYLTLSHLYGNQPAGSDALGVMFDRCLLNLPAIAGARRRKDLVAEEIVRVAKQNSGDVAVTALGSNSADELFAAAAKMDRPERLRATLLDFDARALAHVSEQRTARKIPSDFQLINENVFRLAAGRGPENLANQDVAYSISLPDYLADKSIVALLNYAHSVLKPGGRAVFGFFNPRNPDKAFMDYVLDCRVIHRDETAIERLFLASAFQESPTLQFEEERIVGVATVTRR